MLATCPITRGKANINNSSVAAVSSIGSSSRGLEWKNVTTCECNRLQGLPKSGGAKSDAVLAKTPKAANISIETAQIIEAWPKLPRPVKVGILAMVRASLDD